MKNNDEIEIYVHIPFCVRKCDYCDFVSFACAKDTILSYFKSLKNEIINMSETMAGKTVVSVFFGGGTPSLPDDGFVSEILTLIKERFNVINDAEISIEVNPNSASLEKLCGFYKAGFNRISIGLQSANNEELKLLSRVHTYEEFLATYEDAKKAGFENINIDLMSALPKQTIASYKESLNKVLALKPKHISAYSLIIEEGTPFYEKYKDGAGLPDEDTEREMYYLTKSVLKDAGYERYEISNYALPGFECRHNIGYWKRRDYIGFGLNAASLIDNKRYTMHADLKAYINGDYTKESEELSKEDIISEFMFLGLRLTEGVSVSEFKNEFDVDIFDIFGTEIEKLKSQGLLEVGERIYLTDKGMDVANYCMSEFLLES